MPVKQKVLLFVFFLPFSPKDCTIKNDYTTQTRPANPHFCTQFKKTVLTCALGICVNLS